MKSQRTTVGHGSICESTSRPLAEPA